MNVRRYVFPFITITIFYISSIIICKNAYSDQASETAIDSASREVDRDLREEAKEKIEPVQGGLINYGSEKKENDQDLELKQDESAG